MLNEWTVSVHEVLAAVHEVLEAVHEVLEAVHEVGAGKLDGYIFSGSNLAFMNQSNKT